MTELATEIAKVEQYWIVGDFVVGELLNESSLDAGEHPARCHELDRVRAIADLAAHRAATFVHTVANSRR